MWRIVVWRGWAVGLTAVLAGLGGPPVAHGALRAAAVPACSAAPHASPGGPPGAVRPAVRRAAGCRAQPTEVLAARDLPRPVPGYHHLGATSADEWSGIMGRLTVRDPAVRRGTHDFLATRFMAKREAGGRIAWLEAGWAETGWSGDGRQRIYTYDTNRNSWTFYDQYALHDGDQVWVYVHTDTVGDRSRWQAWLWWNDDWHLLTAQELPLGGRTRMEEYVEVYVDPDHGGPGFPVPPIAVDNVQVKTAPQGDLHYWRADVATAPGGDTGRYCLDWQTRFDTWRAGDCGELTRL
jgi:hypothetical protein